MTVTNSLGTVTSSVAVLTVAGAPRPPKPNDMRFKYVDAFPMGIRWQEGTVLEATDSMSAGIGTPLGIGPPAQTPPTGDPTVGGWWIGIGQLPLGIPNRSTNYLTGDMNHLQLALQNNENSDSVIGFLDLDARQNNWAMQVLQVQDAEGGYSFNSQTLAPTDLALAVAQEGAAGHVITAISLDNGQATYVSYGWKQDPSTVYETYVATATQDTFISAATGLAQSGYIITAYGGNDLDGFLLVGTRVKGDTTPRPIKALVNATTGDRGWIDIASILPWDAKANKVASQIWIFEM